MGREKIIVALDVDTTQEALGLVDSLGDSVGLFKVGKQLFTRTGPEIVRQIRARGVDVFLDLKFHDIPQTVFKAVKASVDLDVRFLTLHACGGSEMLKKAAEAVAGTRTQLLAVTVLTSMDDDGLREIGVDHSAAGQVLNLARLAKLSGVNGLVCSPLEIELIRRDLGDGLTLVTPGIRGTNDSAGDQKRTLSAAEAVKAGANYLVVGRPITQAADPKAAAQAIAASI